MKNFLWAGTGSQFGVFLAAFLGLLLAGSAFGMTECDHYLISASLRIDSPEFIKQYRNDDAFANWLAHAADVSVTAQENFNRTNSERWFSDHLRDQFLASSYISREARPAREVDLRNFRAEHAVTENSEDERQVEFNPVYDRLVSTLRRGDRVVFSDAEFSLGEFLGQGNTTMVFALDQDTVLRIPYLKSALRSRGLRVDVIPKIMWERQPALPWRRVRLLRRGKNFEYVIATRVHSAETGEDFLNQVRSAYGSLYKFDEFEELSVEIYGAWRAGKLRKSDVHKATELVKLYPSVVKELQRIESGPMRAKAFRLLHANAFRPFGVKQFLWDGTNWILVDWE